MLTNKNMRALLRAMPPDRAPDPLLGVRDIVDRGLVVGHEGALVRPNVTIHWDVPAGDLGMREYWTNKSHLSIADLHADTDTCLWRAAHRGFTFARAMLDRVAGLPAADQLHSTISVWVDTADELFSIQDVVVWFWTDRGDHPDWYGAIEEFDLQALAVIEPTDWR